MGLSHEAFVTSRRSRLLAQYSLTKVLTEALLRTLKQRSVAWALGEAKGIREVNVLRMSLSRHTRSPDLSLECVL